MLVFADGEPVGSDFVPLLDQKATGFESCANTGGRPAGDILEDGNEEAECVIGEDGSPRDLGYELGFRDRDSIPIAAIDMEHDVDIRAAIANVDDSVLGDLEYGLEPVEHSDLAISGRNAKDRANLAGCRIVIELSSVDVISGHNAFES